MTLEATIISMAIYMIALVLVTEYLKKWINVHPLILSWVVALLLCTAWWLVFGEMTSLMVAGVIVLTGATNTAYKINFAGLKDVVQKWLKS